MVQPLLGMVNHGQPWVKPRSCHTLTKHDEGLRCQLQTILGQSLVISGYIDCILSHFSDRRCVMESWL